MKAMVCTTYGPPDVLQLQEVETCKPKDREIRVKIVATTVTAGDIRVRSFNSPLLFWLPMRLVLGIRKPRKPILGVEMAGVVDETGKSVTRFKKGDPVFALTGMRFGGYAEYVCLPEDGLIGLKPDNATYEEAASILFGATTALYFLRKGGIRSGHKVAIYGASGSVGTAAVQLARYFGADVTAICSAANAEWVKALGADRAVDYAKEDFTTSGERYDIVFDAVGKSSKSVCRKALAPNGTFVTVDGQGIAKVVPEHIAFIKELMEAGRLRSVIDRRYPLERVPEAHGYVEQGHKKGNVVITVTAAPEA
ncbi:NAD(P)-dependent alcohol dehydrogenase [Paenibacillus flagellatus]|uniref:NAD(P)-dependent alcohol dehydrogenase n=1 Tax=Paenibacillus flagellatus TaxID=2211139 RepID=A0A2V5KDR6_9BACL|nr:NAD(P)-dependent alcohol dehydrogenase [Paenibacillus flagellatus]PYI56123.1 NAD(P)-dependent alcohol dehydrogenase [Paenibacillus flagellatus]